MSKNPECGGWRPEQLVDPDVEKICFEVKPEIEKILNSTFEGYIPLSFRSQLVHGKNYAVKVVVGVDKCVHAMIFAALTCDGGKLTVNNAKIYKLSEPLVPF